MTLDRAPLGDAARARALTLAIAAELSALHRAGVAHGTLRANVVLVHEGAEGAEGAEGGKGGVKLLGLGARPIPRDQEVGLDQLRYASCDAWDWSSVATPAMDVWSLGLLAFRAFTGREYFGADGAADLARAIHIEALPRASDQAASLGTGRLPRGFDAWFARCVGRVRTDLFADALEAEAAFRATVATEVPATDDARPSADAWEEAERVLRAARGEHGELHMLSRHTDSPPFQFDWWSSPDCHAHALVHRGHIRRGGGVSALATYVREVGLAQRPELHGGILPLLDLFGALPTVPFATSSSFESSEELAPSVQLSEGRLECVLHYVDSRPAIAHHDRAMASREAKLVPHGEGSWLHSFEIELPVMRCRLALGGVGPVEWQFETSTTRRSPSYVVFRSDLPCWRRFML